MTTPRDLTDLMSRIDIGANPTLPAGTWLIDKPIAVPPGQTLRGSGMADTIIKMTPWDGPVEEDPRGAVILLGEGSSVEGITVDARDACMNGIVAIRVSGVITNSCRVLSMCAHTYAFWFKECAHLMCSHCEVDGGAPNVGASPEQEGIEVLGGEDITIQNFSVINCGNAGINLFHDLNKTLKNCTVKDGVVSNCGIGLCASAGADCNVQAIFSRNVIRNSRIVDIKAQAGDGSIIDVLFEQARDSFESYDVNVNCFTAQGAVEDAAMTETEQNEAICEALIRRYHKPTQQEIEGGSYYQYEPRFTRSQDEIHDAKIALLTTPALVDAYACFLGAITGGRNIDRGAMRVEATTAILFANAAQQCEATLRAIGKWKK